MYTQLTYTTLDRVAVVTLARPKVANAISRKMTREIDAAFQAACADDDIRCILVLGVGKHFSSGHDLGSAEQLADTALPQETQATPAGEYLKWHENDVDACLRWRRLRKPLVVGLQGYTIYHGSVVACCADVVIAAENLRYMPSLVEANLFPWAAGLHPQRIKEVRASVAA